MITKFDMCKMSNCDLIPHRLILSDGKLVKDSMFIGGLKVKLEEEFAEKLIKILFKNRKYRELYYSSLVNDLRFSEVYL